LNSPCWPLPVLSHAFSFSFFSFIHSSTESLFELQLL
jgi:hypothetical protein